MRFLAILLLLLSTPAAAATITFNFPALTEGRFTSAELCISGPGSDPAPGAVVWQSPIPPPEPSPSDYWDYVLDARIMNFYDGRRDGFVVDQARTERCYGLHCIPDSSPTIATFLVGDVIRFRIIWETDGVFTGIVPEFQAIFSVPDGVTVSPVPLPASWLMLVLGLAIFLRIIRS